MPARQVGFFGRAISTAAVALSLCASTGAKAEIIKFDSMFRGTTVSAEECARRDDTVFVRAYGYGICMRYYYSVAGGEGSRAMLYLSGDKRGIAPGNKHYRDPSAAKDVDTTKIEKRTEAFSRQLNKPAIYLARMGIDGSSGHFADRRTYLELWVTSRAIDAIKKRHNITVLDIVGQSGGSTLLSVLLAKRQDISCAVLGSGLLVKRPSEAALATARGVPSLRMFDPQKYVADITRSSSARILVLSDPHDTTVPLKDQKPFVDDLRRAGRNVEHYYIKASGESHHGASTASLIAVRGCAQGESRSEIKARISG